MVISMHVNKKVLIWIAIVGGIILFLFLIHVICAYRYSICDRKVKFTELLGMDFTDVEITDIQYINSWDWDMGKSTQIYAFLNEAEEAMQSREYYNRDWNKYEMIPPGDIEELDKIGIGADDIQNFGVNYMEVEAYPFYPIKLSGGYTPYSIFWYQLDESHSDRGNIVLLTYIPRKIIVDVDKVIQD